MQVKSRSPLRLNVIGGFGVAVMSLTIGNAKDWNWLAVVAWMAEVECLLHAAGADPLYGPNRHRPPPFDG